MSEDEIIKGITNIIYTCNEIIEDTDWYNEEEIKSAEEQSKLTQGLLDLYNKTKEDKSRYYYEWKHLEANIINKINELEEINMDVFTFEIAEDLKGLLEEK